MWRCVAHSGFSAFDWLKIDPKSKLSTVPDISEPASCNATTPKPPILRRKPCDHFLNLESRAFSTLIGRIHPTPQLNDLNWLKIESETVDPPTARPPPESQGATSPVIARDAGARLAARGSPRGREVHPSSGWMDVGAMATRRQRMSALGLANTPLKLRGWWTGFQAV